MLPRISGYEIADDAEKWDGKILVQILYLHEILRFYVDLIRFSQDVHDDFLRWNAEKCVLLPCCFDFSFIYIIERAIGLPFV